MDTSLNYVPTFATSSWRLIAVHNLQRRGEVRPRATFVCSRLASGLSRGTYCIHNIIATRESQGERGRVRRRRSWSIQQQQQQQHQLLVVDSVAQQQQQQQQNQIVAPNQASASSSSSSSGGDLPQQCRKMTDQREQQQQQQQQQQPQSQFQQQQQQIKGNDEPRTNLIINYLPQNMNEKELYSLFVTIGPVESCRVMKDYKTGYSYGFGFVNYAKAEDAATAISTLNGLQVQNKRLKVSFARPSGEEIKETNLYVTNLPRNITESQIDELFSKFGNIVQKNILRDKLTGLPRGVAFVR
ncbi:PREDICTED: sex-lethal homolog isoform X1 [Wasmannia auropunctata]|uniref:sex-lethal homolog isoform X1 n=2 Tax=Wasmannia auropunctata TaxID=64793 RepID=UPI0005EE3A92|nr:PREDICTED: sex-lethal homolog isoform X1 [Wasmannia auropunctata]